MMCGSPGLIRINVAQLRSPADSDLYRRARGHCSDVTSQLDSAAAPGVRVWRGVFPTGKFSVLASLPAPPGSESVDSSGVTVSTDDFDGCQCHVKACGYRDCDGRGSRGSFGHRP